MTLPPEKIGDKEQRYEVRATCRDCHAEKVIGWAECWPLDLLRGVKVHPGLFKARVIDRRDGTVRVIPEDGR